VKIAFFDPVGSFFSVPTLHCLFEELNRMSISVDVFLRFGADRLIASELFKAYPFPVPLRAWSGNLNNTLRNWKWFVKYHSWKGHNHLREGQYDLVFGINPEGVVAAYKYWEKTGTPYIYISFEMFFKDELESKAHLFEKDEEIIASQNALFVISQDKTRGMLLSQENHLPLDRIEFLPVAPSSGPPFTKTNYLRQQFKIEENQMILLHSGTFRDWTCADELIESLHYWPDDLVLVVHTHYEKYASGNDPYLSALKSLKKQNIFISNIPLAQGDYQKMICSAEAGLVFYKPNNTPPFGGKNIQNIGLSSGKLASYARCGLPIICGRQEGYKKLINTFKFGMYTDQLSEIPSLACQIQKYWDLYSQESLRFFNEQLDFKIHWPKIWKRIQDYIEC
jgi:hypothetical protein